MSIFQRIWGKKARDKPKNYLSTAFTFLFGPTSSGNVVTERTAMQTTAVYAWRPGVVRGYRRTAA